MSAALPPNLLLRIEEAMAALCPRRAGAPNPAERIGLVLDFDGTISELVPVPANAVIAADVLPPLQQLSRSLALTAVMSGRAAQDIRTRVGIPSIAYIGNHGAERIIRGAHQLAPQVQPSSVDMQSLLNAIRKHADDAVFIWENKGLSASIHYRTAPDEANAIAKLTAALSAVPELQDVDVFWGNKVFELRLKNGVNKGTAIDALINEYRLTAVVFLGDDTTDADALHLLQRRKAQGDVRALGIAVVQSGTPASVLNAADYSLNGVPEVALFLNRFAEHLCAH